MTLLLTGYSVEVEPLNLKATDEDEIINDGARAADEFVEFRQGSFDLTLRIGRSLDALERRILRETHSVKAAGKAYQAAMAER
jgi:hypothetical protein